MDCRFIQCDTLGINWHFVMDNDLFHSQMVVQYAWEQDSHLLTQRV